MLVIGSLCKLNLPNKAAVVENIVLYLFSGSLEI